MTVDRDTGCPRPRCSSFRKLRERTVDTGTTYDTIVYAGFWRRFAAFLIDIVIVLVITNVIELALRISGRAYPLRQGH